MKFKFRAVVYIPAIDKIGIVVGFTGFPSMPYRVQLNELDRAIIDKTIYAEDYCEDELFYLGDY